MVKIYNTTPKNKNYFGIIDIAMLKKSFLTKNAGPEKKNTKLKI
jgi:hypothetical protein